MAFVKSGFMLFALGVLSYSFSFMLMLMWLMLMLILMLMLLLMLVTFIGSASTLPSTMSNAVRLVIRDMGIAEIRLRFRFRFRFFKSSSAKLCRLV